MISKDYLIYPDKRDILLALQGVDCSKNLNYGNLIMSLKFIVHIDPSLVPPRLPYDLSTPESIDEAVSLVRRKWEEVLDPQNIDVYQAEVDDGLTLADLKVTLLYDEELFNTICTKTHLPEKVNTDIGQLPWKERIKCVSTRALAQLPVSCLKGKRKVHFWEAWPALVTDGEFLEKDINQIFGFHWMARNVVYSRLEEMKVSCPEKVQAACTGEPTIPFPLSLHQYPPVTLAQIASLEGKKIRKLLPHLFPSRQAFLSNQQVAQLSANDFYVDPILPIKILQKLQGQPKALRYELILGNGDTEERRERLNLLPHTVRQDLWDRAEQLPWASMQAFVECLSADEFEDLWPRLSHAPGDVKSTLLSCLSDEKRDRLQLSTLAEKDLMRLFSHPKMPLSESQRRFQRLSDKDQELVIRRANAPYILELLTREQLADLDTRILSDEMVRELFPSLSEVGEVDEYGWNSLLSKKRGIAWGVSRFSKSQLEALFPRLDPKTEEFIREMDYSIYDEHMDLDYYYQWKDQTNPFWAKERT